MDLKCILIIISNLVSNDVIGWVANLELKNGIQVFINIIVKGFTTMKVQIQLGSDTFKA